MSSEPRSAAACILVRGESEPRILLARRNDALRFMGGHYVFPGGRIQDDDPIERVRGASDAQHARAIFAVAREVFEETGLLCAHGALPLRDELRAARRQLLQEELTFDELLQRYQLAILADEFQPAGEWLTPPISAIRFATRYFLYRLGDVQQEEELIEGEITALDWVTAAEARRRWLMGEMRISTPVAYTLRQLAGVPLPAALPRLQRGTERSPGEHNWFEIRRGITLVPVKSATLPPATHTNCVIVGEESLFVVDPGANQPEELAHLERQLDHLLELGGRVEAILLTHSHPDHTDAAEAIRARYQAPIWAHSAVAGQVAFTIDRSIGEGDVIVSGRDPRWQLHCLHTPGHDPGHLCFLETSTGSLLAGDMVANPGSIIVSRQFGGDMDEFIRSLQRLLEIDCKLIIPAHGQPAGKPGELIQQQLAHRLWREDKIKQAYAAGATTFEELLAQAYDDAPPQALPWARHALDAHLARLGIALPQD
ncbi:MAG: MBL fold metallo-hydrolase [Planctomycetaceae bacterium]|nr:MBL fold metallo-hydrolase [Planctomycetaceae bacterium]